MAAPKLMLKFDTKELDRYLTLVSKNVGNLRPVMVFGVSVMANEVVANFRMGGRPPYIWPPLKISTVKQRQREGTWGRSPLGQNILMRFGTLFQSFTVGNTNNFTRITRNSAEYGTILVKAKWLQEGTKNMAARPFLYWTDGAMKRVMSFAFTFAFQPDVAKKFGVAPGVSSIPKNLFMGVG